ncbi:histidine phosphatase family protein [Candidatus Woesearchaeota archaeon]|nr:histidine phosphatase family protein [Candidatus Woesearchaeota archaeon]
MKLHIYLFRHGQTTFNRDKRFTGWLDAKLTKLGKQQAKIVAKKLKNKKFEIAYSNDLSRCTRTLKEVLKYHPAVKKIKIDKRLRERSYGSLQGKTHKEIIAKYGQEMFDKWHRDYNFPPPKGESIKMVEKRVNAFIKDLLKMMKKEKCNVAISASGNSMRPFRKYFEHSTIKQMMKLENPWDDYFEYTINV